MRLESRLRAAEAASTQREQAKDAMVAQYSQQVTHAVHETACVTSWARQEAEKWQAAIYTAHQQSAQALSDLCEARTQAAQLRLQLDLHLERERER